MGKHQSDLGLTQFVVAHQKFFWSLLLAIGFVLSSFPLFSPGMFKIHDFTHGARIVEMNTALEGGHFPVRWSQNFGYGYGMPLFQFYAPLPYYLGAILFSIGFSLVASVKILFLVSNLITLLGAYFLGKKLYQKKWIATFLSLSVTLAPYRFLNLYVRGALSELWGIMALPWIILGLYKTVFKEKNGIFWFVVSLTVLFLSHNITSLLFAPFVFFLFLIFLANLLNTRLSVQKRNMIIGKAVARVVFGVLLALGMSAFYLIPAYLEKDFTQVDQHILADYFDYRIHFVYPRQLIKDNWGFGGSEWGPNDPISFFLGYGQVLGLVLAALLVIKTAVKSSLTLNSIFGLITKTSIVKAVSMFLIAGMSVFLTLHYSMFIWERVELLKYAQFPWRFLSIVLITLPLASGYAFVTFLNQDSKVEMKRFRYFVITALFILLLLNARFARPELWHENYREFYYSDSGKIQSEMSQTLPDYLSASFMLNDKAESDKNTYQSLIDLGVVRIEDQKPHLWKVSIHTDLDKLVFPVADYPGWRVKIDRKPQPHEVSTEGLISLSNLKGGQVIELELGNSKVRQVSDTISLMSILIAVTLLIMHKVGVCNKNVS